jgi:hypothetical protein
MGYALAVWFGVETTVRTVIGIGFLCSVVKIIIKSRRGAPCQHNNTNKRGLKHRKGWLKVEGQFCFLLRIVDLVESRAEI